ncbi:MAG: branched-chain amino acid ABC transporter permease, partial [Deltaproteobacteria bacterium]|nr:branched-chain amino acid ABC transporter permease [Deltaproteobacteria bacterium]
MVNIDAILAQVFNGIQFGVLIALLATGLSLIFGMLGIINFAHGSLYMLGAYLVWSCVQVLPIPGNFWLGLVITLPLMAIVGLMIERFL